MKQFFEKYKTVFFLIVVVGVGFFVQRTFFNGEEVPAIVSTQPVGQELFSALDQIQRIQLDTSVLNDPIFASLQDFGLNITRQQSGRSNPFIPFPANTTGPTVSPASSVQTETNATATSTETSTEQEQ